MDVYRIIRQEIAALQDHVLLAGGDFQVFLLQSQEAPTLLRELYRLREVTFSAIGEGTGKELDTDEFDAYYRHMILWNVPNGEIAGAYRLGFGPEIMREKGIPGFYTASLVHYSPEMAPLLAQSMELGRSFIVAKYQREVLCLKFLLAGLAVSTLHCPRAKYFVGPVSMSAAIPSFYQTLAVYFLKRDFAFPDGEKLVQCPHPFVPDPACANAEELLKDVPPRGYRRFRPQGGRTLGGPVSAARPLPQILQLQGPGGRLQRGSPVQQLRGCHHFPETRGLSGANPSRPAAQRGSRNQKRRLDAA